MKIAKVTLPIALDKEFDYILPKNVNAKIGSRLLVDLRGKKTLGILTGTRLTSHIPKIKPVIEVLDSEPSLSQGNVEFAAKLSTYYPYTQAEFLFMMLPSYLKGLKKISLKSITGPKRPDLSKKIFVKASDFTDRYLVWREFIKEKLKIGSVLVIFPQLSFLTEAQKIIEKDFDNIKVLHSFDNDKIQFENWSLSREKSLILGTRVALFYYPPDLTLLIMEEENSPHYFQEEKPFHHLFDVALLLSDTNNIDVVFSANYPSIYAYNLIKHKKIQLVDKGEEKNKIKIVNIGEYQRQLISPILVELLRKGLSLGKRAAVLWNKTGFASYLACSSCGYIFKCASCSGFLKLSLVKNKGICPYCGSERDLSKACDLCNGHNTQSSGIGIEKIEVILKRFFPEVKIGEWEKRNSDTQIVIATSKIISSMYERERFDNGFLLDADYQMSRFDYEATFDTFLYIKNLSRLFKENLYVFTRNKDNYLFESTNADWTKIYEKELSLRKELLLPPFGGIAKITLRAPKENSLLTRSNELFLSLKNKNLEVYGPFKEQPYKLRGKFRYSITAKLKNIHILRKAVKEAIRDFRTSSLQIAVVIR